MFSSLGNLKRVGLWNAFLAHAEERKSNLLSSLFNLILLFSPQWVLASDVAHGIPWATISAQTFNFTIAAIILFRLLKEPVVSYFKTASESFVAKAKQAETAKREAEKALSEATFRLKDLADRSAGLKLSTEAEIKKWLEQRQAELKAEVGSLRKDLAARVAAERRKLTRQLVGEFVDQCSRLAEEGLKSQKPHTDYSRFDLSKELERAGVSR